MKIQFAINVPRRLEVALVWVVLNYRRLRYGEAFRIIPLTKGLRAIVSPEDYDRLAACNWCASKCRHTIYAQRTARTTSGPKRQHNVRMHREVLGITDDRFVDHQNHNGLDNRRSNLRITTPAQNGWNRNKTASSCSSRFKGVCWSRKMVKWHAQIKENGRQTTIGYFDDEESAARAYDAKAKELYGQYAALNFPGPEKDPLAKWSNAICYGKFTG
ncbi:MAG: AP2 domain-containing protein [Sedimentisphaerales bacterium]